MPRNEPSFAPPAFDDASSGGKSGGFIYLLMLVLLVAFGGFVWNLYGGRAPDHIAAQPGAYRVAPSTDHASAADAGEQNAMYDSLDGTEDTVSATPVASSANGATTNPQPAAAVPAADTGAPRVGAAPAFAANGAFVAQIAALQSEAAVNPAWTRMSSRAPQLFGAAHLDVLRADLGQRGVYYRVRAGYFADRANATRFCDRIKQMGQDCIVVAR